MAEDNNKMVEELNDEQLDEANGGRAFKALIEGRFAR